MTVLLYSVDCPNCQANHTLGKIKQICKQKNIDFDERRTIYWDIWEKEANQIMELNEGLKLPFLYDTASGKAQHITSLETLDSIENFIKRCEN